MKENRLLPWHGNPSLLARTVGTPPDTLQYEQYTIRTLYNQVMLVAQTIELLLAWASNLSIVPLRGF